MKGSYGLRRLGYGKQIGIVVCKVVGDNSKRLRVDDKWIKNGSFGDGGRVRLDWKEVMS